MKDGFYDRIARRLYVSADFVKRTLYAMGYGGAVDPWLRHLLTAAMNEERHGEA